MTRKSKLLSKTLAKEKRQAEVARLALEGQTLRAMAATLGCSVGAVRNDLQNIRKEWRETRLTANEDVIAEQLAQLKNLRREAYGAWHDSKECEVDTQTVIEWERLPSVDGAPETRRPISERTTKTRRQRLPDPRYLAVVAGTLEREAKLLGLDVKKPASLIAGRDNMVLVVDLASMSEEQLVVLNEIRNSGQLENPAIEGTLNPPSTLTVVSPPPEGGA